jgi:hypothetical protein
MTLLGFEATDARCYRFPSRRQAHLGLWRSW